MMKEYLEWLKEETLAGIWSKGVALARTAKAELVSSKPNELKFKLQTSERMLAYEVTLWPGDEDAFCNCTSQAQPCHHVIATAQIYDQGRAVIPDPADESSAGNTVRYEWVLDPKLSPSKLSLKRTLAGKPLNTSLLSLIGGIESGRISQALPTTSRIDLQIDETLTKGTAVGQKIEWPRLLKLISELEPIPLAASARKLTIDLRPDTAKLLIQRKGKGELTLTPSFPEFTPLAEGLCLKGDVLSLQPDSLAIQLPTSIKTADLEKFMVEQLPELKHFFEITIEGTLPEVVEVSPRLELKVDRLTSAGQDQLMITPILYYPAHNPQAQETVLGRIIEGKMALNQGEFIPIRNRAQETEWIQKLRREMNLGLNQTTSFTGKDAIQFSEKLSHSNWEVFELEKSNRHSQKPILESFTTDQVYRPHFALNEGRASLFFTNRKGESVSIEMQQLKNYAENFTNDPTHPVMDSLKEYGKIPASFWEEFGDEILRLVTASEKAPLSGLDRLLAQGLVQELEGAPSEPSKPAAGFTLSEKLADPLRPYQKIGVEWILNHLNEPESRGALLADEMGLGKTIQTLSSIQTPALIVVPTSLLSNWKSELKKFRPELTFNLYHGQNRKWNSDCDVTVTTYGVLRQEVETFKRSTDEPWAMMVMDEAHQLRNRETQSTQAVLKTPARFKLALSGTPIQNQLKDLYTLFQIIQPTLFSDEADFFSHVERPRLFQAKTSPFIMRRLKENVLTELPAKTHMVHPVELTADEQKTYDLVVTSAKKEIVEQLEAAGASPMTLFETLLRVRQVCDHRGLFMDEYKNQTSSKLSALSELLIELTQNGHSVLVYSQWTQFLNLIEVELRRSEDLRSVPYERLDGSTQNRAKVIDSFQNQEGPTIFLLSLHAGGVGLNLTKADQVIFCDPWWNPFVELQAEDRVHRMGQEKPVFIHRLITENSIEEGIRLLQAKKLSLQSTLTVDEIQSLI